MDTTECKCKPRRTAIKWEPASLPGSAGVLEDSLMNIIYYTLTYPLMMVTQGHQVEVFTLYLIFDKAVQVTVYLKY